MLPSTHLVQIIFVLLLVGEAMSSNRTINCNGTDTNCTVDCIHNNCRYSKINGSLANSLIVECGGNPDNNCERTDIHCPINDGSSCILKCAGMMACQLAKLHIEANSTEKLEILCQSATSCKALKIYSHRNHISDIHSVNLNCVGSGACYNVDLLQFDGTQISNKLMVESLNVNCDGANSCEYLYFDTKMPVDNMYIVCNGYSSCWGLNLPKYIKTNMNMICNGSYSCGDFIEYSVSDIAKISIQCISGCYNNLFGFTRNISIESGGIELDDYNSIDFVCVDCVDVGILIPSLHHVNITCIGPENNIDNSGCLNLVIFANNSESVSINANTQNSWRNGDLFAGNATNVSLSCISKNYNNAQGGCRGGNYFVPLHGLNLNCVGYGCHGIGNFYINGDLHNNITNATDIEFKLNSCGYCDSPETCLTPFNIHCDFSPSFGYSNKDKFNISSCTGNNCSCELFVEKLELDDSFDDCDSNNANDGSENLYLYLEISATTIGSILLLALMIYIGKRLYHRYERYKDTIVEDSLSGLINR